MSGYILPSLWGPDGLVISGGPNVREPLGQLIVSMAEGGAGPSKQPHHGWPVQMKSEPWGDFPAVDESIPGSRVELLPPGWTCKWWVGARHDTAPMHHACVASTLDSNRHYSSVVGNAILRWANSSKGWRRSSKLPDNTLGIQTLKSSSVLLGTTQTKQKPTLLQKHLQQC